MLSSALFAFLHHLLAFSLVAAIAAEMVLFSASLTLQQAQRLRKIDRHVGAFAGLLLLVGLARVGHFEKGADYYFSNAWFLTKLTLYILAAIVSVYPTVVFMKWKTAIQRGEAPQVEPAQARKVRLCLIFELVAILGILLAAPLMARGFG